MEVKEIKQFLKERGVNPYIRIDRNGGWQYLFNLMFEFKDKVKNETRDKVIKTIEQINFND